MLVFSGGEGKLSVYTVTVVVKEFPYIIFFFLTLQSSLKEPEL